MSKPRYLLIRVPLPKYIGDKVEQFHWLSLFLPNFPVDRNGFRSGSPEIPKINLKLQCAPTSELTWSKSKNWSKQALLARGKIAETVVDKSILVLGAGSVGSAFCELIARLGCYNITVLDHDLIEAGNLSRHVLTIDSIGHHKAEELAKRLNLLSPYGNFKFKNQSLEYALAQQSHYLENFDVIVDATASDDVINLLETAQKNESTKFISLSTGLNAKKLFLFTSNFALPVENIFRLKIDPLIEEDNEDVDESLFLRENIGCWHPLFPARHDDIFMLVSASIKIVEDFVVSEDLHASVTVISQKIVGGKFRGIDVITCTD